MSISKFRFKRGMWRIGYVLVLAAFAFYCGMIIYFATTYLFGGAPL